MDNPRINNELTEEEQNLLDSALEELHASPTEEQNPDIIPENLPTLLIDNSTSRFSDATWYDGIRNTSITLVGLGGIGSWTALLLARLHLSILHIYDPDIVDETNLSGQLYSTNHIGLSKVVATHKNLAGYSNFYSIQSFSSRYDRSYCDTPVMICGLDNMSSRKQCFESWKDALRKNSNYKERFLFIDARLAAESFQVFCMTGEDAYLIDQYESQWLFSDEEAEQTVCSYKQTSFCANMVASVITNLVVNFVSNLQDDVIPRELPFFTYYDATSMFFKIKNS